MIGYSTKLALALLILFMLIEYRLIAVANETENWRGLIITTVHILIVAMVAYWGLVRSKIE
jgi:hypothetical protein